MEDIEIGIEDFMKAVSKLSVGGVTDTQTAVNGLTNLSDEFYYNTMHLNLTTRANHKGKGYIAEYDLMTKINRLFKHILDIYCV